MSKKLGLFLSMIMVLSMVLTAWSADFDAVAPNEQLAAAPAADAPSTARQVDAPELTSVEAQQINAGYVSGEIKGATEPAIYLIRLAAAPLARYQGGIADLSPTSPAVTGESKLDVNSPASVSYLQYLAGEQASLIADMERNLERSVNVVYQYFAGNNGMAVWLTPDEAAEVSSMRGVTFVQRDFERELQTDYGPTWIGAAGLWDGTTTGVQTKGEGIIIGVIDTGINPLNPSFADVGDDAYDHDNPWGAGNYVGVCDPGDPLYNAAFPCNDKLIGAHGYPTVNGGDPTDYDGHGSHTSSTAGGNVLDEAVLIAPTTVVTAAISGVAPHANIVAYAACCTNSALSAAIDDAILDEVDVINYSIGSDSASDVWNDFDSVGYLNAREAGIFVATSAGNAGPDPNTMGSPADAPWLLAVGNSTHNRKYLDSLVDMSGGDTAPPPDLAGKGITAGYGPETIVYAGDFPNANDPDGDPAQCLEPYPADTWVAGEIVVCDRGDIPRVDKGANVLAGGAGGYVLANLDADGESVVGDPHYLPAVHIGDTAGDQLRTWLATGTDHVATITGMTLDVNVANADIMASGSSRGANQALPDIIAPSVVAPGTDIFAAYGTGGAIEWNAISGTSMASPHAAGAAALMMSLYPSWTPAEIQSAMMSTAWTDVLDSDGATPADPFDMGSGRIDLSQAANAGLVLDESIANYWAADPDDGGDPKTLNLASMGDSQCLVNCSWTRTVSSTLSATATWTATVDSAAGMTLTVTPSSFALAPGATQVITVEADVAGLPSDVWAFGEVTLTPDDAEVPAAHFPVAVMPTAGVLPASVDITTRRDAGSELLEDLESIEVTNLTIDSYGLVQADLHKFSLYEDPTNTIPEGFFDDLTQVFWMTMTVPAGAHRLVAEILDTTSPDLDMGVGFDADGNGLPDEDELDCQSASGGPWEYCDITDPAAGTWWVIILNWEESAVAPDPVILATGVVPDVDDGNMWFDSPAGPIAEGEPYDIRLFWDDEDIEAGDVWYGAFALGTAPTSHGDIRTIPVNIYRYYDDVTKIANTDSAFYGDTITYDVTVLPNVTGEDLTYTITDTIPAGLTYVPDSATPPATVDGDELSWTFVMPGTSFYAMSTSDDDPFCATPYTWLDSNPTDGYTDWEDYGFMASSGIEGDTLWYSAFSSYDPFNFFGVNHTGGVNFTDDGFGFFDPSTPGSAPWFNADIPDPADPNALMAALWSDWEIVYDLDTNRGVSLVGDGSYAYVEWDDIQLYDRPDQTIDLEMVVLNQPSDAVGDYEVIYAFDNISTTLPWGGTIGIENDAGSDGYKYAFDDAALDTLYDGMAICFNWVRPNTAMEISYQATVDATVPESPLTNDLDHVTDDPGSIVDSTEWDVYILGGAEKEISTTLIDPGDHVVYTITLQGGPTAEDWTLYDAFPPGLSFVSAEFTTSEGPDSISWSGTIEPGETVTIILTLQGDVPGYYTNVAEVTTQGFTVDVEAPELFVTDFPIAGLTAENDSPTMLGQVTNLWAAVSEGSNVSYDWDFGDGTDATDAGDMVNHIYPAVGVYTATVTASNSEGPAQAETVVTITPLKYYMPLIFTSP